MAKSVAMPTRAEKSRLAHLWRVTLQGKPADKQAACQKLEACTGKRGRCIVSIAMAREDVIVLRWYRPRKYERVMVFLAHHLKNHFFQVAPVHEMADVKEEDDKKEDKKEIKECIIDQFPKVIESVAPSSPLAESVASPSSSASAAVDPFPKVIESVAPSSPHAESFASPSLSASQSDAKSPQATESVAALPIVSSAPSSHAAMPATSSTAQPW